MGPSDSRFVITDLVTNCHRVSISGGDGKAAALSDVKIIYFQHVTCDIKCIGIAFVPIKSVVGFFGKGGEERVQYKKQTNNEIVRKRTSIRPVNHRLTN